MLYAGASPRIFEWGSNRRQGGQPTPKYPKNRKIPDFGYFILESGGSNDPIFKGAEVSPPPPTLPRRRRPWLYVHVSFKLLRFSFVHMYTQNF